MEPPARLKYQKCMGIMLRLAFSLAIHWTMNLAENMSWAKSPMPIHTFSIIAADQPDIGGSWFFLSGASPCATSSSLQPGYQSGPPTSGFLCHIWSCRALWADGQQGFLQYFQIRLSWPVWGS